MERDEFIRHWNSFCCLTEEFEATQKYVYHGLSNEDKNEMTGLVHGDVYSDAFRQIILVACSEFETMCKYICNEKGKASDTILKISKCVLENYPKIVETMIYTKYSFVKPLKKWGIIEDDYGNEKTDGLSWWNAYNNIKHDKKGSFKEATLDNAFMSLASLYIILLYVLKESSGTLQIAKEFPPRYFRCEYIANNVVTCEGELPDFGNRTTNDMIKEKYGDLLKTK